MEWLRHDANKTNRTNPFTDEEFAVARMNNMAVFLRKERIPYIEKYEKAMRAPRRNFSEKSKKDMKKHFTEKNYFDSVGTPPEAL